MNVIALPSLQAFLSTPSARRATGQQTATDTPIGISIHALREEGDLKISEYLDIVVFISIHALREEGDWPTTSSLRS